MIYAGDGAHPTKNVPTSQAERATYVLADDEILTSSRWASAIEEHYGRPMDMEGRRMARRARSLSSRPVPRPFGQDARQVRSTPTGPTALPTMAAVHRMPLSSVASSAARSRCTGNATHLLHDEQEVTVSCAEGDEGFVYEGKADNPLGPAPTTMRACRSVAPRS